ncbi:MULTISPECIES: LacI family DNA-binding transcriptional regulator [Kaistia]|uniref:LacI family DNA-binding transcriptional regulator n=1 Tax=Kaistia nematophila TaxID=2994654 RepID=A0A9X3E4F7_9HYPH|nr:LacI family DNA-binding transcriptional regulator [Kaistia nematophila]MCX5571515.1 LacI family DNA-binding transcriptional regulator [Kaistia nematophila]
MATIRDVAKMAKVSISTVSVALRDGSQVTPETLRRITEAAEAVGYSPNPVAQSLKAGRSRLIGVVIGSMQNPWFGDLMAAIEETALEHHHLVTLSETKTDPLRERAIIDALTGQRVGGIIISPHLPAGDHLQFLATLKTPLVAIDHKIEALNTDFVGIDNELATAMLTQHLLRLGHRRIAHIAGTAGLWTSGQREKGFRATLLASGIEPDDALIVDGQYSGDVAYDQTMRLLTRPDRPTAIVAANSLMALGALQAINDLRFNCPDDISLATIDSVPWASVICPQLTVVVQPIAEIAQAATMFLLDRIHHRGSEPIKPREKIFVPKFIAGRSCAPPRG